MHTITAVAVGPAFSGAATEIIWLTGLAFAIKFRRALFTAASLLTLTTATIRGLDDADVHVATWLADMLVYARLPVAMLIVTGFVAGRYPPRWVGRGWRL